TVRTITMVNDAATPASHPRLTGRVSTSALILSVTVANVCPGASTKWAWSSPGSWPSPGTWPPAAGGGSDAMVGRLPGRFGVGVECGVGVPQPRQVARPGLGVQLGEHPVVAGAALQHGHGAAGVGDVAEGDRPGRAGRLAGRLHGVAGDALPIPLGLEPRLA